MDSGGGLRRCVSGLSGAVRANEYLQHRRRGETRERVLVFVAGQFATRRRQRVDKISAGSSAISRFLACPSFRTGVRTGARCRQLTNWTTALKYYGQGPGLEG